MLLLNRVLTVGPGSPGSHRGKGWEEVTQAAIAGLAARGRPLVAILWGRDAQTAQQFLPGTPIIASAHPSPMSADRGFFGSRPFRRANDHLRAGGRRTPSTGGCRDRPLVPGHPGDGSGTPRPRDAAQHPGRSDRDPLGFLARMRDRYGDVVQFPIPRPATYLVSSRRRRPAGAGGNARNYDKDTIQYRSLSLVTGDGLLVARNDDWRQQRPVVQPAFHHSFLPGWTASWYGGDRATHPDAGRACGRTAVVDVESAMMDLTLRVVGRCLFGDDLRGRPPNWPRPRCRRWTW